MARASSNYTLGANADQYNQAMRSAEESTKGVGSAQKKLEGDADKSASAMDRFSAKVDAGREKLNTFGKVALTAGAAMTAALIKNGLAVTDTLGKTADKLNVATEKLQGLRHAAEITGAGSDKLDKGLEKLTIRVSEAAAGSGVAAKSFNALGLSADQLVAKSPDEIFEIVSDRMNRVESSTQKAKIAYDIFGRSGVDLINTMALGSEGLAEMQREAEAAGVAIGRIDVAKAEIANDSMFRVRQQVQGFSQHLAIGAAPIITKVSELLFDMGQEAGGMGEVATKAIDYIVTGVGVMADGVHGLKIGWLGMKLAFQGAAIAVLSGLDWLAEGAHDLWYGLPWNDEREYTSMFDGFLSTLESEFDESRERIDKALMRELPSQSIKRFVNESRDSFDEQATSVVNSQARITGALLTVDDVTAELAGKTASATDDIAKSWKGVRTQVSGLFTEISTKGVGAIDTFIDGWIAGGNKLAAEFATNTAFQMLSGLASEGGYQNLSDVLSSQVSGATFESLFGDLSTLFTRSESAGDSSTSGVQILVGEIGSELQGPPVSRQGSTGVTDDQVGDASSGSMGGIWGALIAFGVSRAITDLQNGTYTIGDLFSGQAANDKYGDKLGQFQPILLSNRQIENTIAAHAGPLEQYLYNQVPTLGGTTAKFIDDVFGMQAGRNNAAAAEFDIFAGTGRAYGIGKSFDQANLDTAEAVLAALQEFSGLIGGGDFSGRVKIGNRSGVKFNGQKYESIDDFLNFGYEEIINSAQNLDPTLRGLLLQSEGTAIERGQLAASLVNTRTVANTSASTNAFDAYVAGTESLHDTYLRTSTVLNELIASNDGTVESYDRIVEAGTASKDALFELAFSIRQLGEATVEQAEAQAQAIRESVLSREELGAVREYEFRLLTNQLSGLTDPEDIAENASRRLELNAAIWRGFTDEERAANAELFEQRALSIGTETQSQLDSIEAVLVANEDARNQALHDMMQGNLDQVREQNEIGLDAANLNYQAALMNLNAAQINAGQPVTQPSQPEEIVN